MSSSNPTNLAARRYRATLAILMVAYLVVLFAVIWFVKSANPAGVLRYVLLLLPVVPVGFMLPAVLRFFRDTDEFERRVMTDSLAIAGGITAALAVTYGFLEIAGLPHPSAWFTWCVLMFSWAIARIFVSRHYGGGC